MAKKTVSKAHFAAGKTVILSCSKCGLSPHYQDTLYGRGRRVHNIGTSKAAEAVKLTCTVCGTQTDTLVNNVLRLQAVGLVP